MIIFEKLPVSIFAIPVDEFNNVRWIEYNQSATIYIRNSFN
jgi:hypothetical protein